MTLNELIGGAAAKMWVSGATYAQGKFAVSPTDFTPYIRKVAGAGTTDPASDTTNWQQFGQSAIKRIIKGVTATTGTNTVVTIASVNVNKCELRNLGVSDASSARVELTSSTTVAVFATSSGLSVGWELTERY